MNLLDVDTDKIYKYGSQNYSDYGWGCVYRNIQSMRAFNNLPVPTIPEMQQTIGIDPSGTGQQLWIEPVDARQYFPWETSFALYNNTTDPESHLLRTKLDDFDTILTDKSSADKFLHDCFSKNRRVLLDDSLASYILTGIVDDTYVYIDPHVQTDNIRTMSRDNFYNRNLWMMMC